VLEPEHLARRTIKINRPLPVLEPGFHLHVGDALGDHFQNAIAARGPIDHFEVGDRSKTERACHHLAPFARRVVLREAPPLRFLLISTYLLPPKLRRLIDIS
jgi:hypothetical protein